MDIVKQMSNQRPLTDVQRKELLNKREKEWNKPISLWKKMRLSKGQMTFTGKR